MVAESKVSLPADYADQRFTAFHLEFPLGVSVILVEQAIEASGRHIVKILLDRALTEREFLGYGSKES